MKNLRSLRLLGLLALLLCLVACSKDDDALAVDGGKQAIMASGKSLMEYFRNQYITSVEFIVNDKSSPTDYYAILSAPESDYPIYGMLYTSGRLRIITAGHKIVLPSDCSYLFRSYPFETLDLSKFDTSNVTNMSNMFAGCANLKSINLSKFDTSNVTDMTFLVPFYSSSLLYPISSIAFFLQ